MTPRQRPQGQQPGSLQSRLVLGALAGLTGASCMDLVRFSARRAGIIDRRIPEEVARQAIRGSGSPLGKQRSAVRSAVVERTLHLGYGATLAAAFAAPCRPCRAARWGVTAPPSA